MEPQQFQQAFRRVESEVQKVIVGHDDLIRKILIAFFAGGHVLLEGVPGLGKTLLVKSLSQALGMSFKRIQFTPDLMPSDIVGTEVLTEDSGRREFQFKRGPIFAHVVLADEINRATPKTQSAVLEAMEEKQVTVFGDSHILKPPFIVLATQNPIELEGTYPLPEAQVDRFFFKLLVTSPAPAELKEILKRTTGTATGEISKVLPDDGGQLVGEMQQLLRQVMIAPPIEDYVVRLVHATQPDANGGPSKSSVKQYIRYGASPRGSLDLQSFSQGLALLNGRDYVLPDDIKHASRLVLPHGLIVRRGNRSVTVNARNVIDHIVESVAVPI